MTKSKFLISNKISNFKFTPLDIYLIRFLLSTLVKLSNGVNKYQKLILKNLQYKVIINRDYKIIGHSGFVILFDIRNLDLEIINFEL